MIKTGKGNLLLACFFIRKAEAACPAAEARQHRKAKVA
jgi:hypothetical protein